MVSLALEAAEILARDGVNCEVIDLRTIVPLDVEAITASLEKTHRLLVVDEGYAAFGLGAEIAATVGELAFDALDAPVGRLHLEPVPHPFNPQLEAAVLPSAAKIVAAAQGVVAGVVAASRRPRVQAAAADRVTPAPEGKPTAARPAPKISSAAREKDPADGEAIRLPHGDLTVSEAKVLHWRKQPGDGFSAGEVIAEVETDKAVMEVEAPAAGRLVRIAAPAGAVVVPGSVVGVIGTRTTSVVSSVTVAGAVVATRGVTGAGPVGRAVWTVPICTSSRSAPVIPVRVCRSSLFQPGSGQPEMNQALPLSARIRPYFLRAVSTARAWAG